MMHNELLHVNLPPIFSFSDNKIIKLDLVFGSQGWPNPLREEALTIFIQINMNHLLKL